jgi:hypothetical protein
MLCSMSFGARCSSHGVHRERNCCNWLQLLQLVPTCCNWLQRVVRSKLHRKGRVACLLRRVHCMLSAACPVSHHLAVRHTLCGHGIACALRRVRRCGLLVGAVPEVPVLSCRLRRTTKHAWGLQQPMRRIRGTQVWTSAQCLKCLACLKPDLITTWLIERSFAAVLSTMQHAHMVHRMFLRSPLDCAHSNARRMRPIATVLRPIPHALIPPQCVRHKWCTALNRS